MSAALRLDGVVKRFGGLTAVNELGFELHRGEIAGLLGPNGSGKTTALNLVSGLLKPDAGSILLDGKPIQGLPANRIARLGVARTFQLVRVLESMDCRQNVIAGLAFGHRIRWGRDAEREAERLLDRVGLAGRAATPAGELQYIDQKRLELARALALSPEVLLLDEWLAGLNPSELLQGIDLVRSLREDGITILMVEHVMDAVRALCGRCIVMAQGRKIADGPTAEALAEPEVMRAYLGDDDA